MWDASSDDNFARGQSNAEQEKREREQELSYKVD